MPWLDHAPNRLHRYFADGWYDLYDGVVVAQDAQLTGLLPDNRTIGCETIRPIRTRSNR